MPQKFKKKRIQAKLNKAENGHPQQFCNYSNVNLMINVVGGDETWCGQQPIDPVHRGVESYSGCGAGTTGLVNCAF
jgi:hypothetical protein